MSVVIDSSVTLAWVYDDERTATVDALLDMVDQNGAWVPSIWRLEVANSLQQSVRRGRIVPAGRDQALANLALMNISIDSDTNDFAWTDTLKLSSEFGLTTYDACYLELAKRRVLPLATLDRDLRTAAQQAGIRVL